MRAAASGFVFLLCWAGVATAAAPRLRLDLPAGSLGAGIAALAERSGANIGTTDPALFAIPLPPLHLRGSPETLLDTLSRRAGVSWARIGPGGWRIARLAQPPPVLRPAPQVAIIVQAVKRAAQPSDYPSEIIRISGADLGRYGVTPDTTSLMARVPILASTDWGAGREKLFLRGIADSSFTGSSPTLLGEYFGDQPLTSSAPDPDLRLYDIAAVAVLAGPQGTLYGAGALGGLIRVEANAPVLDATTGAAWGGLSSTAHGASGGDVGAVLNLPLVTDRLALRVVGYGADDPGYIDDLRRGLKNVNRVETRGGRAALRWAIAEGWRIDLGGIAQRIDNRDAPYAEASGPPLTRSSAIAQPSFNLFLAGNLVVSGRIGSVDVRSTTGIVHQSLGETFAVLRPGDVTSVFSAQERPTMLSEETRLSGGTASMNWVAGMSYVESRQRDTRNYGIYRGDSPIARLDGRTRELTGYGEATRQLGGGFSATLGARYASLRQSGESVDGTSPLLSLRTLVRRTSSHENHLLPSAALSVRPVRGVTLFTRYERGFRPGGITFGGGDARFTGDGIGTVEVGMRSGTIAVDRVALTLTGALSRWRHIQADLLGGIGLPEVANIGNGRVYSVDASVAVRIVAGLELDASGFVAGSHLDPYPSLAEDGGAGKLPNVARNGGTVALDYRGRLASGRSWQAGLRVQHVGPSLLGIGPILARPQGNDTTLALGGGIRLGATDLTLNITNLLDSRGHAFAVGTPFAAFIESEVTPLRPRTLRLGARYDF